MLEYEEDGVIKVKVNTTDAELVGTFYDSSSDKGIILFPGFTEHRSSLDETAKRLNKHFKAWTFDINSQGESTGDWDLKQMTQSVHEIQEQLRKRYGLKKLGALGNSIGGMAVGIVAAEDSDSLDAVCLTTTPVGLQDYTPDFINKIISYIPQQLFRAVTLSFDRWASERNENYRKKTHSQFKIKRGYRPYAQFGALKISNLKKFMGYIRDAPRIDEYVHFIEQPILFIYGGNDKLNGIKNNELPKSLKNMIDKTGSKQKAVFVVEGADHSLNTKTQIDDCFNQDRRHQFVKEYIVNHFTEHLL